MNTIFPRNVKATIKPSKTRIRFVIVGLRSTLRIDPEKGVLISQTFASFELESFLVFIVAFFDVSI